MRDPKAAELAHCYACKREVTPTEDDHERYCPHCGSTDLSPNYCAHCGFIKRPTRAAVVPTPKGGRVRDRKPILFRDVPRAALFWVAGIPWVKVSARKVRCMVSGVDAKPRVMFRARELCWITPGEARRGADK